MQEQFASGRDWLRVARRRRGHLAWPGVVLAWAGLVLLARPLSAASVGDAEAMFFSGKYAECIATAAEEIPRASWQEAWRHLKIRAELESGRDADALATLETALTDFPSSIRLKLLGHRVCLFNGRPEQAKKLLDAIQTAAAQESLRYADTATQVALGRFFLLMGVDARLVLETFYDPVQKSRPDFPDVYLATGELALEKGDNAMAAEAFRQVVKLQPADPAGYFGVARACAESVPEEAGKALLRAVEINPNHADSLLLMVDRLIDSESYAEAETVLGKVLAVNGSRAEAWGYRAVLAHLAGDAAGEKSCRKAALRGWQTNPAVDCLIGRKLAQKYRFAEAAGYQREALRFDPSYVPAKIELSQDLLRLGQEEEGWRLADEVYEDDGYNVVAHNLVTLRDTMARYATLEADGFVLRMEPREADVYGPVALELLARAREDLCEKYDVELDGPIVVEIFAEQKDFAVRTFGMPAGEGFLGVCFGNVITANSPASQGATPANWKAVLWHEFCHTVTLRKTRNKMPRWLSEGLSVYEEKQADAAWGERMNGQYRELLLADDLPPVSRLSAAFLNPPSPLHLQFAYFESSLVVEYLFKTYGVEKVRAILADLGSGMPIETALTRHTGSLQKLDEEFAKYARARAEQYAPKADWTAPDLPPGADLAALGEWLKQHPNNVAGLAMLAHALLLEEKWAEAKAPLESIVRLSPEDAGAGSAYDLLAQVHRALGETEAERAVLERIAALDDNALSVDLRLIELCQEAKDWAALAINAERALAINPLLRAPHRGLAEAAERLGDPGRAIASYRALLYMDPQDPADAHYRLARLLQQKGESTEAKRHVLMALEEAPRFRAAHRTLLEIVEQAGQEPSSGATAESPSTEAPPAAEIPPPDATVPPPAARQFRSPQSAPPALSAERGPLSAEREQP